MRGRGRRAMLTTACTKSACSRVRVLLRTCAWKKWKKWGYRRTLDTPATAGLAFGVHDRNLPKHIQLPERTAAARYVRQQRLSVLRAPVQLYQLQAQLVLGVQRIGREARGLQRRRERCAGRVGWPRVTVAPAVLAMLPNGTTVFAVLDSAYASLRYFMPFVAGVAVRFRCAARATYSTYAYSRKASC